MDNLNEYYTIGKISTMCNIPIKTLRYYDEIGLLLPEYIDEENGYRHYSQRQMLYINIIKHFRILGFSLNDIKVLINGKDLTFLQTKLEDKLKQTNIKITELEYISKKLESDINYLNVGRKFSEYLERENKYEDDYGIEIGQITSNPVLFTRYKSPCTKSSFIKRFSELNLLTEKHKLYKTGPLITIFHDYYKEFDYDNADIEVCIPIAGDLSNCNSIREYGNFLGAKMLHKGSYLKLSQSYAKVIKYIEENGYKYIGPATEKYIIDSTSTSIEDNYVTEIILPIEKN